MISYLTNFGKNVKYYRELQGMSQEKLAELVGVSTNTISSIENGKSFLKITTLEKLCTAIKVKPQYLFHIDEERNSNTKYINAITTKIKNLSLKQQKQVLDILNTFE